MFTLPFLLIICSAIVAIKFTIKFLRGEKVKEVFNQENRISDAEFDHWNNPENLTNPINKTK
jgi:hypothetical protein